MDYKSILFSQNHRPRLIICIDLFVFFLMGAEGGDVFFLKNGEKTVKISN